MAADLFLFPSGVRVSFDDLQVELVVRDHTTSCDSSWHSGWCRCGADEEFGGFPDDGECHCGVHKHHVHCARCGGVSQVG